MRDYVVQYEESDFDFISRLCEREGIFYWFDHAAGRDRVVFADANGAARVVADHQGVGFAQGRGGHGHAVSRLGRRTRRVRQRVDLLDYNWRAPALTLASSASVAGGTTGVWTDTDDHYRDKTAGDRLARVRAEEIAARRCVYEGASDIETLRPGDLLEVSGHLVATLDRKFFVEAVVYEVSQKGTRGAGEPEGEAFRNEIVAIDSLTPYRPALATRLPRIAGVVYATVDGPDMGAAAPIDAQGRYKVILPFDTSQRGTGKATRWVRMAQGLSGVGFGIHFPLRVGAEVLLVHVNGDPDRPIIAGTTPNAVTASPVTQKNATQSVMQTNAGIRVELEDHATGT
jgi:type VI secretion system secreted protein VgrG